MLKGVVKYLLSFCIFLLGGYQLYAHSHTEGIQFSFKNSQQIVGYAGSDAVPENKTSFIKPASPGTNRLVFKVNIHFIENEEDDEWNSFKKHLKSDNYQSSAIFIRYAYSSSYGKTISGCSSYLSYISLNRYLTLQVFRI